MDDGTASPDSGELTLFAVESEPTIVTTVVEETVLREWGRSYNLHGPKPPTYRKVRRLVAIVAFEQWCPLCESYVSTDIVKKTPNGGGGCRPCVNRRALAAQSDERREMMRWRANVRRVEAMGIVSEIDADEWLTLVGGWSQCSAPDCGGPFEIVDHKLSLVAGGRHHASNLQPLCKPHHFEKSRVERQADASSLWERPVPGGVG
jgi:hypothetical protein